MVFLTEMLKPGQIVVLKAWHAKSGMWWVAATGQRLPFLLFESVKKTLECEEFLTDRGKLMLFSIDLKNAVVFR